ncbi:MAG: exonuclease SbcCD subunit D [Clostridiaceae bacterium]|nr:exonuclease SbcCD subunit D [Clostridiaceae bacterium]
MKFVHTSDLHIGKVVNGFSMLQEQIHALEQITEIACRERADAVFLCGDLYDRSIPPAFAVSVLDEFLTKLVDAGIKVLSIAGNHDCAERIGFASRILEHKGLYMEGGLREKVRYVDFKDGPGNVRVHMVPYAKPVQVKALYRTEAENHEDAMKEILKHVEYDGQGANILLAHQFVVNQGKEPELSDSESRVSVGGTDQVEVSVFDAFDYVALGHIHGGQKIGGKPVYYSGSPVKYSFSEANHEKHVLVGEMTSEGLVSLKAVSLTPIHDMRKIKGKLSALISPEVAKQEDCFDYILAVLTNEEELIDPIGTIRSVYPNVMQLQIEKRSQDQQTETYHAVEVKQKSAFELFSDFFQDVMGKEMSEEQAKMAVRAIEQAKEAMN